MPRRNKRDASKIRRAARTDGHMYFIRLNELIIQLYLSRALEQYGAPTVKVQWTEPKQPRVRVKGYRG